MTGPSQGEPSREFPRDRPFHPEQSPPEAQRPTQPGNPYAPGLPAESYPGQPHSSDPYPSDPYPGHPYDNDDYDRRRQALELEAEEHRLREDELRSRVARMNLIASRLINAVYFLVGALEVLLSLRFVLQLAGANIQNTFASTIYGLSEGFAAPFSTLFSNPSWGGDRYVFDINLITAMVVYGLLGLLAGQLIKVFVGNPGR